jgi:hypothetical protein
MKMLWSYSGIWPSWHNPAELAVILVPIAMHVLVCNICPASELHMMDTCRIGPAITSDRVTLKRDIPIGAHCAQ